MTKTETKAISVWQDEYDDDLRWIVSDDLLDEHGAAITSTTLQVWDERDNAIAAAREIVAAHAGYTLAIES